VSQQLSIFDILEPPPAPPTDRPTWFRINLDKKGHSYAEIGVHSNGDGTWACTSRDTLQGFCGHGGPFFGKFASFNEALFSRIEYLRRGYQNMADGKAGSCCTPKHQAMARVGLKWLDDLMIEHRIHH
jgi:hypothetical protein